MDETHASLDEISRRSGDPYGLPPHRWMKVEEGLRSPMVERE
jgi:hypothetical protein